MPVKAELLKDLRVCVMGEDGERYYWVLGVCVHVYGRLSVKEV